MKIGNKEKQILDVLSDGEVYYINDLLTTTAEMEVKTNGASWDNAAAFLAGYGIYWRTDAYLRLKSLINKGLIVRVSRAHYQTRLAAAQEENNAEI